jgi:hypothetical protein
MTVQDWPDPTSERPDDYALNYMLRSDYRAAVPNDRATVPSDHINVDGARAERTVRGHECACTCDDDGCTDNGSCSGYECECECDDCEDGVGCSGHECDCAYCEKGCEGCNGNHCPGCEGQPEQDSDDDDVCPCAMCNPRHGPTLALVCTDGCVIAGSVKAGNANDRCSHGHVPWVRHFRMA